MEISGLSEMAVGIFMLVVAVALAWSNASRANQKSKPEGKKVSMQVLDKLYYFDTEQERDAFVLGGMKSKKEQSPGWWEKIIRYQGGSAREWCDVANQFEQRCTRQAEEIASLQEACETSQAIRRNLHSRLEEQMAQAEAVMKEAGKQAARMAQQMQSSQVDNAILQRQLLQVEDQNKHLKQEIAEVKIDLDRYENLR